MKRREMLLTTGATMLGLSSFPLSPAVAAQKTPRKILYFTRSVVYEHSVVHCEKGQLSHSGRILAEFCEKKGIELECSKDGSIFEGDLDDYDAFVFYSCGDMTQPSVQKTPPMTPKGVKRLIASVAAGKPFVGIHSSCYWGKTPDALGKAYINMVGGDFVAHGAQQESGMVVTSPKFPGANKLDKSFRLFDEWYALHHFADNLHVILAEDCKGMKGPMYQRPLFPSTWARMHGKGRVFFTAMGHREDVWTNKTFQQVLFGGMHWALGDVSGNVDITPNVKQVTPQAEQLKMK